MTGQKTEREPLFRIVKRDNVPRWEAWLIRIGAVVAALLVSGLVSAILAGGSAFGTFFSGLFEGVFGTPRRILNLFQGTAILLCIALAVAPAFKMRFWNIGAEGQVLMGGLGCVICIIYFGGKIPEWLLLIVMLVFSLLFSAVWTVIPAVFKAKWRTNETLFTLMMNYVAMQLVLVAIYSWVPQGTSMVLDVFTIGTLPKVGGSDYTINIIIVALLSIAVFLYFRFSKQGYELSVVGESENTAKYVGINVKKVIIRTMIISGLLCGVAGYLLVAGTNHTLAANTVGGRGFTAILIAWLGKFSPASMALTAFLYAFIEQGTTQVATNFSIGDSFSDVLTGIFFFLVIGCEFFINYKIKFRPRKKNMAENAAEEVTA